MLLALAVAFSRDSGTVWYQTASIYGTDGYQRKGFLMKHVQRRVSTRRRPAVAEAPPRERVLKAAFALFRRRGFAGASTLEIATRAQVSKRDLYALFPTKDAILTACIAERARRMRAPLDLAATAPASRAAVAATLVELGASVLRGVTHPDVLAVYRLAIAESDRAPEVAH